MSFISGIGASIASGVRDVGNAVNAIDGALEEFPRAPLASIGSQAVDGARTGWRWLNKNPEVLNTVGLAAGVVVLATGNPILGAALVGINGGLLINNLRRRS